MEVTTTQYKNCDVVHAVGRVDSATAPQLEEVMNTLIQANRHKIVFDMGKVTFVSSAGWWVLIGTQKTCKKHNGELVIASIEKGIRDSLCLVGMDEYFRIFDDLTAAVGNV